MLLSVIARALLLLPEAISILKGIASPPTQAAARNDG